MHDLSFLIFYSLAIIDDYKFDIDEEQITIKANNKKQCKEPK